MDGSSFLASFKAAAASSTKEMIQFSGSIDSFPIRGDEVFKNMFYWEINDFERNVFFNKTMKSICRFISNQF